MRSWRFGIALVVLSVAVLGAQAQRPNIVLIVADDLGYGDLSSYCAEDLETPHIDRIVNGGMRIDPFYANSPVCSPTRASILTGRIPDMVGVPGVIRTMDRDSWGYLHPDAVLLSEVLRGEGYYTALVGKWHLGLDAPNRPTDRGFDEFRGWLGDMMDDYWSHRRHDLNYMRHDERVVDPEGHATDLFTKWAVEVIHARAAEKAPFFLYLAHAAPHFPVQPPQEWLDRVRARELAASEERVRLAAFIEHMDDGVGRVMEALHETGVAENTLVVFTSDNGGRLLDGASNGELRGGKQEMYEGGIRVPAAFYWPSRIAAGSRSMVPAATTDLFPTLAEAAGAAWRHKIDGVSLLPTLRGEPRDTPERKLVFVRREGNDKYMGLAYYAVRKGDWKLVQNTPTGPFELYDIASDPQEEHNRVDDAREVFRDLAEELRLHILAAGAVPWRRR